MSDPLAEWHKSIFFVLLGLSDIDLKDSGVRLDYSRESLVALERVVLDRFAVTEAGQRFILRESLHGFEAYVGETLMRVAGGQWAWRDRGSPPQHAGDGPVACADPVLGLAPVAPLDLLLAALATRSGDRLVGVYDRWAGAVEEFRARDSSWRPVKQRTMADPPERETAALREWLAEQEAGFPRWVAEYGAGEVWDFEPASLPAVEEALRRSVASSEELNAPEHRRLRDGAAWYVGETFRRGLGGDWVKPRAAGNRNFPRIEGMGPRQASRITPVLGLEAVLDSSGYLTERYARASRSVRE